MLVSEVLQARLTVAALGDFEVEAKIVLLAGVEHAEEMAAELFPRRAAEAMAPPNGAKRMDARIAAADGGGELFLQRLVVAQGRFQFRHLGRGEPFVEEGVEISVGVRHCSMY